MDKYARHQDALRFIRTEMFSRKLTYHGVAIELSRHTDRRVTKAEAWNAEHRDKRCAPHIKQALVSMGLLAEKKRWRFFFEVDEKMYHAWREFLGDRTFSQYMNQQEQPWD
jgi:hypothetical protein